LRSRISLVRPGEVGPGMPVAAKNPPGVLALPASGDVLAERLRSRPDQAREVSISGPASRRQRGEDAVKPRPVEALPTGVARRRGQVAAVGKHPPDPPRRLSRSVLQPDRGGAARATDPLSAGSHRAAGRDIPMRLRDIPMRLA
jgi:hypothetical protein